MQELDPLTSYDVALAAEAVLELLRKRSTSSYRRGELVELHKRLCIDSAIEDDERRDLELEKRRCAGRPKRDRVALMLFNAERARHDLAQLTAIPQSHIAYWRNRAAFEVREDTLARKLRAAQAAE